MSLAPEREKDLPSLPVDIDISRIAVDDEGTWPIPSNMATFPNTNKSLPSINVENTLSEEEIRRLHELWNGAGLSARAHRMRQRQQNPALRRIPAPIFVPEPDDIPPTLLVPSAGPSITSMTPPNTGMRKRWGRFSGRSPTETHEAEKKAPKTFEKLCAMAQDRLKKKLRYTKSAPNLGDRVAPLRRAATVPSAVTVSIQAVSKDRQAGSGRHSLTPGTIFENEDMDENAIYFTIDPNWRASRGSVQFECITPIPDSPTAFGRPDSPLLHRHHSLDQLAFAAQQATAMEFPEVHSRHKVLDPIDELHAYLEP